MSRLFLIPIFLCELLYSQNVLYLSKFEQGNKEKECKEVKIKVKDVTNEEGFNCNYNNEFDFLYPVYIENFDYKVDLYNNWGLNYGYIDDNDVTTNCLGNTWMGSDFDTMNLDVLNGKAYLRLKKQDPPIDRPVAGCGTKSFKFTSAILHSFYSIRQGIVTGRIKVPENPNLWPAFWLFGNTNNRQEIDVFEFYDKSPFFTPCDVYHRLKNTIHGMIGSDHCSRGRKYPVHNAPSGSNNDFFDSPHNYQVTFTDYKVDFFVDETWRVNGTKFFDKPFKNYNQCQYGSENYPKENFLCENLINLNEDRKIHIDKAFPSPSTNSMNVIINGGVNTGVVDKWGSLIPGGGAKDFYTDQLYNSWDNFPPENRDVEIDQIVVWQPINCSAFRNICSLQDIFSTNGNSHFLAGGIIKISSGYNNCSFVNSVPFYPLYQNNPLHFLATEEIEIGADAEFQEGTYLRAEIIPCGYLNFSQKGSGNENIHYAEVSNDELANEDDSDKVNIRFLSKRSSLRSTTDNGSISMYPIPSSDKVNIDMDEEDFNDIIKMEIIDNLGRKTPVSKANQISVADLSPGFYELCFYFSHGFIVVKSFVKE